MDSLNLVPKIDVLVSDLHKILVFRGQTLSLAESCTGGLISSHIAKRAGVSAFYVGGVISYSAEIKKSLLGVRETTIQCVGEVSALVALEMARGAKKNMKSTWALSVTGIAGPSGGSEEKPVGTVCFAVAGPSFESTKMQHFKNPSREEIQLASAHFALMFLWDSVKS